MEKRASDRIPRACRHCMCMYVDPITAASHGWVEALKDAKKCGGGTTSRAWCIRVRRNVLCSPPRSARAVDERAKQRALLHTKRQILPAAPATAGELWVPSCVLPSLLSACIAAHSSIARTGLLWRCGPQRWTRLWVVVERTPAPFPARYTPFNRAN